MQTTGQIPEEQEQQQQDWDSLFSNVLITAAQIESAAGGPSTTPRTLHRVSRKQLGTARSCIRRLNLGRYETGRQLAQRTFKEAATASAALATAAAVPHIPWALLAATPSLTSLDIRAEQVQHLAAGTPTAAAAPAAAAAGSPAVPGVLAATLGRLRRLRVTDINNSGQVGHLGSLLRGTTQLTQLVLKLEAPVSRLDATLTCTPLLEGLRGEQPAAGDKAAAAAATLAAGDQAAAPSGDTSAAPAAGGGGASVGVGTWSPVRYLPALRGLEVPGRFAELLEAWLAQPGVAAQLAYLELDGVSAVEELDLSCLGACSGLRRLMVQDCDGSRPVHMPDDLTRLTALTKLGLQYWSQPELPEVVWGLTQLRHLSFYGGNSPLQLPTAISRLSQLQHLDLSSTPMEQLPQELGAWLPQLEVLDIESTYVAALPPGLTRLTSLLASYSSISPVQGVGGLVSLKHLDLSDCFLQPPLQAISCLTALETLQLGLRSNVSPDHALALRVPSPLPALRSLTLSAGVSLLVTQTVVGAPQLTHLAIEGCLDAGQMALLEQLGVLPQLRSLCLGGHGLPSLAAALPWVQQQPHLTNLTLTGCVVGGSDLQQLPPQLEALTLQRGTLAAEQPAALSQLSCLRTLTLAFMGLQQLPPWLHSLQSLEVLSLAFCHEGDPYQGDVHVRIPPCLLQEGWELLVELPLLRRVDAPTEEVEALVLQHVPHLCWV